MSAPRAPVHEELRLVTRVAQHYHERGRSQRQIAERLGLSTARVSRLLRQAAQLGIVRTTVHVPEGAHAELAHALERHYGLDELIVVDTPEAACDDDAQLGLALAGRAAGYLEQAVPALRVIGVSSWSATLLAAVDAMRPLPAGDATHPLPASGAVRLLPADDAVRPLTADDVVRPLTADDVVRPLTAGGARAVVQVLGGMGHGPVQQRATRLALRMAELTHAEPVFMLVPGLVATPAAAGDLRADPACRRAMDRFGELSALLTGVGALAPSALLRDSGNALSAPDLAALQAAGAVGDLCLRFFDARGRPVPTPLDARVLGIASEQIRRTRRRIGVAGGRRKFEAVRAALRGGWLSTLVTDALTADRLLADP